MKRNDCDAFPEENAGDPVDDGWDEPKNLTGRWLTVYDAETGEVMSDGVDSGAQPGKPA